MENGYGGPVWHVTYRRGNWSVIHQSIPLRPDTIYVFAALVKSTAPVVYPASTPWACPRVSGPAEAAGEAGVLAEAETVGVAVGAVKPPPPCAA